ncbi:hypothetical protein Ddc_24670 [Ditylenchus destructor]|nr:hypothetical protein Ddc_24670 [Ditylenchus destructor]
MPADQQATCRPGILNGEEVQGKRRSSLANSPKNKLCVVQLKMKGMEIGGYFKACVLKSKANTDARNNSDLCQVTSTKRIERRRVQALDYGSPKHIPIKPSDGFSYDRTRPLSPDQRSFPPATPIRTDATSYRRIPSSITDNQHGASYCAGGVPAEQVVALFVRGVAGLGDDPVPLHLALSCSALFTLLPLVTQARAIDLVPPTPRLAWVFALVVEQPASTTTASITISLFIQILIEATTREPLFLKTTISSDTELYALVLGVDSTNFRHKKGDRSRPFSMA